LGSWLTVKYDKSKLHKTWDNILKARPDYICELIPCPFCSHKLVFLAASGYGSHYRDSDYKCYNCGFSLPVGYMPSSKEDLDNYETKFLPKFNKYIMNYYKHLRKERDEANDRAKYYNSLMNKANKNVLSRVVSEEL